MTSGGKRFEHRRFLGLKVVATRTEIGGCSSNSEPAQLVPADRDAGASGAGAVSYVDLQLTNHLGRYQRAYQEHIAVGKELRRSEERRVGKECRSRWSPSL